MREGDDEEEVAGEVRGSDAVEVAELCAKSWSTLSFSLPPSAPLQKVQKPDFALWGGNKYAHRGR